ncbi:ABC transporter ATP-binding protein/permease, partial [uncultured Thermosynechococcus sp.]|uniref:ABC transporter ATP-binding protein/permease n=1 Tax=uncultured Thermosynechococcus sp. TaxID=436945 RepID=UPI00260921ED
MAVPILELSAADGSRQQIQLGRDRLLIGTDPQSQVILVGEGISRHHALIIPKETGYEVADLGSASGTFLNGTKLRPRTPVTLKAGDRLQIGDFEAIFDPDGMVTTQLPSTVVMGAASTPILQVATPHWLQEFPLLKEELVLGRDPKADIPIDHPFVSFHHAKLVRSGNHYKIVDLGSKNGLHWRGTTISEHTLAPGDVIHVGESLRLTYLLMPATQVVEQTRPLQLRDRQQIRLGRDPSNDMVLDHPVVSRFHARLYLEEGQWYIVDLDSANGTFINNQRLEPRKPVPLPTGALVRIGPYSSLFTPDETIVPHNDSGNLRLDAIHLSKTTAKGAKLLQDISLSILPREFVAIVGGSGAGKSTLLDALNGFRPATGGTVLVNGHDLYRYFGTYRTQIGYVPQDDIIHSELTVAQALDYAARLRLPADFSEKERQEQVNRVLRELELTARRDVLVKQLSGGQRKRVSIGVELLTRPSLFFLDEATSGLDPGTETQMMRLLRQLADQGRTILLVTHATKNVMLCDLVVFLARGGHLAYFGPPDQALSYFDVQDFDEIYLKIESEPNPAVWQQRYRQSHLYQTYVVERQRPLNVDTAATRQIQPQRPKTTIPQVAPWRQWWILTRRNLAILRQDRAALILMLSLAPILGALDFVLWKPTILDPKQGDAGQAFTMAFVTVLIAVMVGSLATMREIVKELEIYRRERMVGLGLWPYIFSKLAPAVVLALYQAAIFLGMKFWAIDLSLGFGAIAGLYLTLFLVTFGGMVMGLLVSALSPTQTVAPLLTILFLVPQITFAGAIIPLKDLGDVGNLISDVTLTRWSYASVVSLFGFGQEVARDACWQQTKSERQKLSRETLELCPCFDENLFRRCRFPGVRKEYHPAVDEPEPPRPPDPGDPPSLPNSVLEFNQAYRDRVEEYNQRV